MALTGCLLSTRKFDALDKRLQQVKSLDKLPKTGALLVIFDFDSGFTCDEVSALRQNPVYRYTAFYAWDNMPDNCAALLDGVFDEQAYSEAKQINERIAACEKNDGAHVERQDINVFICRYLFARKKSNYYLK